MPTTYTELVEVCEAFRAKGYESPLMGFTQEETTSLYTVSIYPYYCGTVADDPDAVAVVYYDEEKNENYCIGYIPGSENKEIATILEMGWDNIFECRISSINEKAHPEQQIHLTIKVKRNAKEA